jgi:predicted RND superfamily exporter protein
VREKIFQAFTAFILRRSAWIIAATVALVIGLSLFIFCLRFENDMTWWVDKDSEIGRMPHYINERFGNSTPLLVAVDFQDAFTYANLNRLKAFSDELEKLPSLEETVSMANVDDVASTPEGVKVDRLIHYPIPDDPAFLAALKDRVLSKTSFAGKIVSADGKIALVVAKPRFELKADMVALQVKAIAQKVFDGGSAKLYFSGSPFLMNSIAGIVINDFIYLIPLVTVLVLGVLYLSFRTMRGVLLPLVTVLFSTALAMGVMSIFGEALNVMSSAVPVILIAVGSAYGIHVVSSYYEHSMLVRDRREIVTRVLRSVGVPVLMAGLTTIVGFLSNVTADVKIVKTFGLYTAIGVAFAMVIALTFIPSVLLHLPIGRSRRIEKEIGDLSGIRVGGFTRRFSALFNRRPRLVIACFAVSTLVLFCFSVRITSKVDILGYFSEDSEPRTASRFINRNFGGFNPLDVYVKGDIEDPDVLRYSLMLEERIKSYGNLSKPSGIADVICELNDAMTGLPTIPETKREIQNLWFFVDGRQSIRDMVTDDRREALLSVLLPSLDNTFVNGLFAHLTSFIDRYGGSISTVRNEPGNPYVGELERVMIRNLLEEQSVNADDSSVREKVAALQDALKSYAPGLPKAQIVGYATGDEAEVPLTRAEADVLVRRLQDMKQVTQEGVREAVSAAVPGSDGYGTEEKDAFARSVFLLIRDARDRNAMKMLVSKLIELTPRLKDARASSIAYALAPLLWKTIPVPMDAKGARARTVAVNDVELTGAAYLTERIRRSIFANQVTSLILALLAVFMLNLFNFRSLARAVISMSAIAFTIMMNFGIMGIFNIPLDFVTAIIGGAAIGTGIDYTIHFMTRYAREFGRPGADARAAYQNTLSTTGKAIVFNALSVGLGYAVLLFSNVVPLRTAGILLAITMFTSSVGAMTLLPAILIAAKAFAEKGKVGVKKA